MNLLLLITLFILLAIGSIVPLYVIGVSLWAMYNGIIEATHTRILRHIMGKKQVD